MTRHLLTLVALFALAGCAPETRTREVDRPDVAPMELPAIGWHTSYTVEDGGGPEEPVEFDCYVTQHESGAAIDYCGFLGANWQDGFSFDVKPWRAENWYWGRLIIEVSGSGNALGSEITVEADQADEAWEKIADAYTLHYSITHLGEIE